MEAPLITTWDVHLDRCHRPSQRGGSSQTLIPAANRTTAVHRPIAVHAVDAADFPPLARRQSAKPPIAHRTSENRHALSSEGRTCIHGALISCESQTTEHLSNFKPGALQCSQRTNPAAQPMPRSRPIRLHSTAMHTDSGLLLLLGRLAKRQRRLYLKRPHPAHSRRCIPPICPWRHWLWLERHNLSQAWR